jgi:hypothetical protein
MRENKGRLCWIHGAAGQRHSRTEIEGHCMNFLRIIYILYTVHKRVTAMIENERDISEALGQDAAAIIPSKHVG